MSRSLTKRTKDKIDVTVRKLERVQKDLDQILDDLGGGGGPNYFRVMDLARGHDDITRLIQALQRTRMEGRLGSVIR